MDEDRKICIASGDGHVGPPTAVYRDGHPTSVLAHQLRKRPLPPPFDRTLTALLRHGAVPSRLA